MIFRIADEYRLATRLKRALIMRPQTSPGPRGGRAPGAAATAGSFHPRLAVGPQRTHQLLTLLLLTAWLTHSTSSTSWRLTR